MLSREASERALRHADATHDFLNRVRFTLWMVSPGDGERILDEKNGIGATTFVGIAVGFAVSSVIAVVVEESCARCRRRLNDEESRAESARDRRDAGFSAPRSPPREEEETRIHHDVVDEDDTHDDDTHDETGAKNHRRPIVAARDGYDFPHSRRRRRKPPPPRPIPIPIPSPPTRTDRRSA